MFLSEMPCAPKKPGFAVINGFNLGRYWEVGPQRSLYIPGPVLQRGRNEAIRPSDTGLG